MDLFRETRFYVDAACTRLGPSVVVAARPCDEPGTFAKLETAIFSVGPAYTGPMFERTGEGCQPVLTNAPVCTLGERIAPDAFLEASLVNE